ncbi:hypothetical protein SPG90_21835 (plasmid) [Enterobacter sp. D2]|uniref:hypothetical protein n=1 Tax=Enterobacter sp. D2 TaxID=3102784 RepID=UPI002ACA948D|nr:hypothetical protein [Enterobacter sp. D2]MDZ5731130.1 hypothetical protein [Enterobacter sp. D2]
MKVNIPALILLSAVSAPALSAEYITEPCHANKFIIGISGNYKGQGVTALYLSDSMNGKPNPAEPVPFVEKDYFWNMKFLYSMAQNAMNLHQKVYTMDCDRNGSIVSFSVVRTNE